MDELEAMGCANPGGETEGLGVDASEDGCKEAIGDKFDKFEEGEDTLEKFDEKFSELLDDEPRKDDEPF